MTDITEAHIGAMLATGETPPDSIVSGVLIRTALADEYTVVEGPIGPLHVAFTPLGVSAVVPTKDESEFLEIHARTVGRPAYRSGMMPKKLAGSLTRALDTGKLGKLPVDLRQLTDFQRAVLEVTAHIPPGEVRPYGWVAKEIGNDGAVRAVGSALGRNPVPIVIPCHRVVKSNGAMGNYAFGPKMKRDLLVREGLEPEALEPGSLRYTGSETTRIFCYPTCQNARRIKPAHRIEFRSPQWAIAAGYRACRVCRPA